MYGTRRESLEGDSQDDAHKVEDNPLKQQSPNVTSAISQPEKAVVSNDVHHEVKQEQTISCVPASVSRQSTAWFAPLHGTHS